MKIFEKIGKSNKMMAAIAVATLAIVAYALVYKPYAAKKGLTA